MLGHYIDSDMQNPLPIPGQDERHFVTALARGLALLGAFRSGDRILGNLELARRTRLPKSTVSRLTYTLTCLGYLEAADDGRGHSGYRLAGRVLALGSTLLQRLDVRALARPLMQQLADETGLMVSLGMPERHSMIYVEACRGEATHSLTLRLNVGSRVPMAATAMGRAYLAICGEDERAALLPRLRARDPDAWPQLEAGIARALEEVRKLGCCTSFGDWQPEVNAVAAAFRLPGQPAMAISCGAPAMAASREMLLDEVRPKMLSMLRRIEALGVPA
jgi:DNA-binding IclR family transcriptional regulator